MRPPSRPRWSRHGLFSLSKLGIARIMFSTWWRDWFSCKVDASAAEREQHCRQDLRTELPIENALSEKSLVTFPGVY